MIFITQRKKQIKEKKTKNAVLENWMCSNINW